MKTIAAVLFATSAALAIGASGNASAMSMTSGYKASSVPSGTIADTVWYKGKDARKGRSCPISRPYQCL